MRVQRRLRHSRELCHLDTITAVGAAGHYAAQEGDIVPSLFDGDVVILNAVHAVLKLGQLVIMRGKEGLCAEPAFIRRKFEHRSCNAHAVKGRGASAYLVKDYKALRVGMFKYIATSFISTIKVDEPDERSSEAPILVNMPSTMQSSAAAAGTKLPA